MPVKNYVALLLLLVSINLAFPCQAGHCPVQHPRPQIWYEDNNLGRAGDKPPDFISRFNTPEWQKAAQHIDVYMIRLNVIKKVDDSFLIGTLLPSLQGRKLALDVGGATLTQQGSRYTLFKHELQQLQRLRDLRIPVSYISLQSPLSKAPRGGTYTQKKRLHDITDYAAAARRIFPNAAIGIIDATPTHGEDWRTAYHALLATKTVDYIHLDVPYELIGKTISWEEVLGLEHYIESRGLDFGLLLTTRTGGYTSNRAYSSGVRGELYGYMEHCGTPSAYIIAAWFPYPETIVPYVTDLIDAVATKLNMHVK